MKEFPEPYIPGDPVGAAAEGIDNPLARAVFVASGPHLSGHQVRMGFETLEEAQNAHEFVSRKCSECGWFEGFHNFECSAVKTSAGLTEGLKISNVKPGGSGPRPVGGPPAPQPEKS